MKVTSAAISRHHIFNQACQLAKHNALYGLITGYPQYKLSSWPEIQNLSKTLPAYGVWQQVLVKLRGSGLNSVSSGLFHALHRSFAESIARHYSIESNVLISLSSCALEAIPRVETMGSKVIVDHGSLHERTERNILQEECDKYGFKSFGNWQYDWLVKRMDEEFKRASYIFCCSDLAKKTMIENGVESKKIFANPLGVDLEKFKIREHENNEKRPFRLLMVSGINPRKGIHYLLDAFVRSNIKRAELWLVGATPNDPRLIKLLKDAVSDNMNIKIMGLVPERELPAIYQQCDLFVLPSLADGWAMVVLQAMACGLPVLLSDMTGAKEVVVQGETGWIVPSRDADVIAEKIIFAYENPEQLINMGMMARKKVINSYSWDCYGERLISWLESNISV